MANGQLGRKVSSKEAFSAINEVKDSIKVNAVVRPETRGSRMDRMAILFNREHKTLFKEHPSLRKGKSFQLLRDGVVGRSICNDLVEIVSLLIRAFSLVLGGLCRFRYVSSVDKAFSMIGHGDVRNGSSGLVTPGHNSMTIHSNL